MCRGAAWYRWKKELKSWRHVPITLCYDEPRTDIMLVEDRAEYIERPVPFTMKLELLTLYLGGQG